MNNNLTNKTDDNIGQVIADKKILLSIINLATLEISGVTSMSHEVKNKLISTLTGSDYFEGTMIKFCNDGLVVDVYINILSSYNVAEIACKVQENIKNSIISMLDIKIKKINVHIEGVDFVEEEIH